MCFTTVNVRFARRWAPGDDERRYYALGERSREAVFLRHAEHDDPDYMLLSRS